MAYNLLGKLAARRGRLSTHRLASGLESSPLGVRLRLPVYSRLLAKSRLLMPLMVSGCLTEFPPLQPPDQMADTGVETSGVEEGTSSNATVGSGTGPDDGGPGLDGSPDGSDSDESTARPDGGSSASTDSVISCGDGETACGASCVPGNSCCATDCETSNAQSECRDNACVITACADDFFDCDGEYDNGCELAMPAMSAPEATEESPLEIPPFDYEMGISVIEQSAWANVPRYELNQRCSTCERNGEPEDVPPASERGVLPSASDFRGAFALAWNDVGLWANVVVIDDEWVMGEEIGETDARHYDNVMVVWDSAEGASDAGSGDDRILFAGIDGRLKDWRQTNAAGASIRVTGTGQCRSVHLQLTSQYLFMGSGGGESLAPGERHGLNIGYNDFDTVNEDARSAERQHFVFGLEMSFASGDYYTGTRTLPQIELVDGP